MYTVKEEQSSHLVEGVDYTRQTKVLLDTEAYELKEDIIDGVLFYHIDVFDLAPSVYKHMKAEWEKVKERARAAGWDAIHSYTQNHAFVRKFGGVQIATIQGLAGEEYGVYQWVLKQ